MRMGEMEWRVSSRAGEGMSHEDKVYAVGTWMD
jgi:hypothetical protein